LQLLHDLLPQDTPVRRVPLHINDERLLGGLDLAATLQAGRPIAQKGVLTLADGGVVLMAMAERMSPATAARLAAVIDSGEVALEREGLASRHPTRFGVVAFDEGLADDERMATALLDRLGFMLDLHPLLPDAAAAESEGMELPFRTTRADIVRARALLPQIEAELDVVQALVAAALQLGVYSIRAPMQALRVARAAAALDGRICLIDEDVALAAALVLSPRATRMPTAAPPPEQEQPEDQEPPEPPPPEQPEEPPEPEEPPTPP
jgi:magnesium chelatase subunit D